MNSCLYECRITHARFSPQRHHFVYRIFLFALDLDEIEPLHERLTLFSAERSNLYSFRERDYFPTQEKIHRAVDSGAANPSNFSAAKTAFEEPRSKKSSAASGLKPRIVAYLAERGVDLTGGRVLLVTLPRVFGYLFNPVSFYFCYDRTGQPVAALAEVTNTFKEMKPYFLGPETKSGATDGSGAETPLGPQLASAEASAAFRLRTPKFFYVSPFSDVDVAFDFTLRAPHGNLSVQIDDYMGSERTLTSRLEGPRRPLTDGRLAWYTLKYPLITLKIIALIHWHALLLWLKRVPWFGKSARAEDQHTLYRPHGSITRPAASETSFGPPPVTKASNCQPSTP